MTSGRDARTAGTMDGGLLFDWATRYAYGRVHKSFLNLLAARKAFIYVLEIFAQLMAAIVFAKCLPQFWITWIENAAGEAAMKKGYGKDPRVNGILASFWALAAREAWSPEFKRVSSSANISEAVSRGDVRHARKMGWSQLQIPTTTSKASNDIIRQLQRGRRHAPCGRLRSFLRRRVVGLRCAVCVAELELRPRDVASVAGRSPVPSRSGALHPKKGGRCTLLALHDRRVVAWCGKSSAPRDADSWCEMWRLPETLSGMQHGHVLAKHVGLPAEPDARNKPMTRHEKSADEERLRKAPWCRAENLKGTRSSRHTPEKFLVTSFSMRGLTGEC